MYIGIGRHTRPRFTREDTTTQPEALMASEADGQFYPAGAGLLARVSWADLLPYMREQRRACLDFAAAWRTRGTPMALRLAEYNETRAERLAAAIKHAELRVSERKAAIPAGEGNGDA